MALFEKKKKVIEVGGQKIELEPKPSRFSLFKKKQQPQPMEEEEEEKPEAMPAPQPQPQPQQQPKPQGMQMPSSPKPFEVPKLVIPERMQQPQKKPEEEKKMKEKPAPGAARRPGGFDQYFRKVASRQKGLEQALREAGVEISVYGFVKRMFLAAMMVAIVLAITIFILLLALGLTPVEGLIFGLLLGIALFQGAYATFLQYPVVRERRASRNAERDILFAAREMIISLRSGMPLFDAIKSVSVDYGDASTEFARIVDKANFGMPLENAIDEAIANSKSPSFRRLMLQASVSIKAGADVIASLQSALDQLSQERVIEMRAYGQKLNAIAMFYMLFGVILPSMGIAVITILTTFISLFAVTTTVLGLIIAVIFLLQIVFLRLIVRSRPVFTM